MEVQRWPGRLAIWQQKPKWVIRGLNRMKVEDGGMDKGWKDWIVVGLLTLISFFFLAIWRTTDPLKERQETHYFRMRIGKSIFKLSLKRICIQLI